MKRFEIDMLGAIALGGALGALSRHGIAQAVHVETNGFPWPTFVTNVSGAFVLATFVTLLVHRFRPHRFARPFFAVGFLGAYTTFSTMAIETVLLVKHRHALVGIVYLASSIAAGLVVAALGVVVTRAATGGRD